jgi:hypothetical protein
MASAHEKPRLTPGGFKVEKAGPPLAQFSKRKCIEVGENCNTQNRPQLTTAA